MKIKSSLALLVAIVMLMTAFLPACGKQEETQTPATTQEATTPNAPATTEEAPAEKEEIEMTISFWDFQEFGDDAVGKKIAEDLKINIKTMPIGWDNDVEQIQLFGASGNLPDFFSTYTVSDATRFYQWLDQGLTRTIPEELIAKYPTVKSIFDADPVVNGINDLRGAYTYVPRPGSVKGYYKASHQVIYYRKDWMENVGISKVPETMDEFYELAKAFTFNDPDKNGKGDTYGLTTAGLNLAMWGAWGIDTDSWIKEDGKFIPATLSQKNVEPLKYFRKLYADKVYDPEFAQNGWKQAIQKITTNVFGLLARNGDMHWINKTIKGNWGVANPDIDPLEVWGVIPPMAKDAGSKPGWPLFIDTGGTEVSAKVDDAKLDRFLELIEYMFKPEVRMMLSYGFEGEDYKLVDGILERTIDPATNEPISIGTKYPSCAMGNLSDWYWDDDIESPYKDFDFSPEMRALGKVARDANNAALIDDPYLSVRYIPTPAKDVAVDTARDSFTQIVLGTEDVQAMFDAYVQGALANGWAAAIDEVNAKAAEFGIK